MIDLGAVAYDQKVVTIWDGFQQYFQSRGLAFDYVLYLELRAAGRSAILRAHPRRVELSAGVAADRAHRRRVSAGARRRSACATRDRDLRIRHPGAGRRRHRDASPISEGKIVAVGARDSPQATLIPLNYLADQGLMPDQDFQVSVFDVLVGKHGDHIGGERDAVRALLRGEADAACILDANHLAFAREGTHSGRVDAASSPRPPAYDHCNFTVLDGVQPEQVARFRELLLGCRTPMPRFGRCSISKG